MSKLPSHGPSLTHHLVENRRQMQRQAASSSFARSGMSATAEGETTVDGTLNVTGNLEVSGNAAITGPLAVHGTAAFDGATTIGGNAAITGTLSLPAGIIDNDALTSPVTTGFNGASAGNFAVSTNATKASCDIVVPAGYTRAVVMVTADVSVKNTGAAADLLYVSAMAVSSGGGEAGVYLTPGQYASVPASAVKMPTGLVGGANLTCTVRCRTASGAVWPADGLNIANVNAIALFLR